MRHTGTIWVEPCPCAPKNDDGHRLHAYKRPVISTDFANDLQHRIDKLADFIEANCPGVQVYRETGVVVI